MKLEGGQGTLGKVLGLRADDRKTLGRGVKINTLQYTPCISTFVLCVGWGQN